MGEVDKEYSARWPDEGGDKKAAAAVDDDDGNGWNSRTMSPTTQQFVT